MPQTIYVLNGPNLNLLGTRQPEIYGSDTLADAERLSEAAAQEFGHSQSFRQTNSEGTLVDWIQDAEGKAAGIIINAGAYSHTSIAVLDALNIFAGPVIELHVSNIFKRESFRHFTYVSQRADGVIAGCGIEGYALAMRRICSLLLS